MIFKIISLSEAGKDYYIIIFRIIIVKTCLLQCKILHVYSEQKCLESFDLFLSGHKMFAER